jgi:uncharacterized membrane protein YeaQ/YmgE (transglycosylase-associated protein family)
MTDIQATADFIFWAVRGITILLMIIASSLAIKKKNNLVLGVVIIGNLSAFFVTQSPLVCWIVSIACIIWASSMKSVKGDSKSSDQKKKVKTGNIIGIILGIGLVAGPLIGYLRQEASLSDPTTQGVLILFAVIGAFMIINNIFELLKNDAAPATTVTTIQSSSTAKSEENKEEKQVRCRFCKKSYSSDYNGCPYCKKR